MKAYESDEEIDNSEIRISLVLQRQGDNQMPILIKDIVKMTENREIMLNQIIWRLKQQNFTDFFDSSVSYLHQAKKIYVFGFMLPKSITEDEILGEEKYQKKIPETALRFDNNDIYLHLKFRKRIKSKLELLKEEQKSKFSEQATTSHRTGKQKQKSIAQVVEKVALWRKLYTGYLNQKGETVHLDLDHAAEEIGIVKKTLDDYLLQIRNGKRYGFNFQKRKNDKIGDLRSFVRDKKSQNQKK